MTASQWVVHETPQKRQGVRTDLFHGQLRGEKVIQTHKGVWQVCALWFYPSFNLWAPARHPGGAA